MGNFKIKSIWENKNTGGNVPAGLENRLQAVEQKATNNETSITTLNNSAVKTSGDQSIGGVKTFTGNTSFNNQVAINSQGQDFTWETTRTWAQNVDNSVARTKDFKYVRVFEKTSSIPQSTTNWKTDLNWTINGINTDGIHEFLIIVSIDNVAYCLNGKIVWKSGLSESKSQFLTISNGTREFLFQLVIKGANEFRIYHKVSEGQQTLQWIRGYIIRGGNLPWKMNQLW